MSLLEVRHLTKRFGTTVAVNGIDFHIAEGRCVSLLGPNGAGKTTTLKMLSGLLQPTTGTISFPGIHTQDIREHIGYLPQIPAFYNWMSGREFLAYVGKLACIGKDELSKRTEELLQLVGLKDARNRRIGGYSGGMRQRLGIAQAMIHRPKLLMLDEPVSALDPLGRREVLEMLRILKRETTILFSTHVLHDAEEICDDVLIMRGGEIALSGSLQALREQHQQPVISVEADASLEQWRQSIAMFPFVEKVTGSGNTARIHVRDLTMGKKELLTDLVRCGISIRKFEAGHTSLEDMFMKVVEE
ncbi:ABC transporter ATP-binding protein [Paenibacillus pectinilyticus]|uniref:ABC transporter ATP-binding protein n=1 Tax=Paenibacillus pectinilyticus TaxID=512399 RepID=A0A1C0ZTL7_9BACL|nr:ABC transporter ATP-binding protein [Paenibacillus pectinilyticus]OCT11407.1 ABC transporter ATP-binding protein [Paenibacillus pectinilyticus]